MTYHHDALVQVTFTCPWGNINSFLDPPPPKSKDKIVVFMVSNCNTGGADERTGVALLDEIHRAIDSKCISSKRDLLFCVEYLVQLLDLLISFFFQLM